MVSQVRFTQGSVMDFQLNESINILYSDPPWGDSFLKYFATATEKATGIRPVQPTYQELCNKFSELIQRVTDYVFIEMSVKDTDLMVQAIKKQMPYIGVYPMQYGNNLNANLIVGSYKPNLIEIFELEKYKGLPFVKYVLGKVAQPNWTVCDPCCGAGYTARATVHHGMNFIGNELNPARLAKAKGYF